MHIKKHKTRFSTNILGGGKKILVFLKHVNTKSIFITLDKKKMLISGTRSSLIKKEDAVNIKCNYCNEQRTHTISIYGKYFHVFWIPFIPFGRTGISECKHCKVTYGAEEMEGKLKLTYEDIKLNTKSPIKHWIGLIIFGVLFILPILISPIIYWFSQR